jgi:hypothetical protein
VTGRSDSAYSIIPLYLGLLMQNGVQQRIVNFYPWANGFVINTLFGTPHESHWSSLSPVI